MNESEYYAGEISDVELNAIADGGEFYLEESGYNHVPTKEDLSQLEFDGNLFLLFDLIRQARGKPEEGWQGSLKEFKKWLEGD